MEKELRTLVLGYFMTFMMACASSLGTGTSLPESSDPVEFLIYETASQSAISWERFIEKMLDVDFILVGEEHDNTHHHRMELRLIQSLIRGESRSRLVVEMLAEGQFRPDDLERDSEGEDLRQLLNWAEGGWDWKAYGPTLESALNAGYELVPGNIPKSELRRLMGPDATVLGVDRLGEASREALLDELDRGHCGLVPRERLGPMLRIQVARDLSMQRALGSPDSRARVLIAGRFHTRLDLGVPVHIRAEYPKAKVASVALVGTISEGSLQARVHGFAEQHDFVFLTAPAERKEDPCENLRRMYKKARTKGEHPSP